MKSTLIYRTWIYLNGTPDKYKLWNYSTLHQYRPGLSHNQCSYTISNSCYSIIFVCQSALTSLYFPFYFLHIFFLTFSFGLWHASFSALIYNEKSLSYFLKTNNMTLLYIAGSQQSRLVWLVSKEVKEIQ